MKPLPVQSDKSIRSRFSVPHSLFFTAYSAPASVTNRVFGPKLRAVGAALAAACAATCAALLTACSSPPSAAPVAEAAPIKRSATGAKPPALPRAGSGKGGYYLDDGPGDETPEGLLNTPDAEPKVEPYLPRANRPYTVFGKTYTPITGDIPFKQRGIASWYGKKFHGQKTSSGELYDMYKMTAAHPTLPIPSYVRVTSIVTGNQVIVRVNDRGPFHSSRIIDLSYTAALRLGYLGRGSGEVEVERLLPDEIARINANRQAQGTVTPKEAAAPLRPVQPRGATVPAGEQGRTGELAVATANESPVTAIPVSLPAAGPVASAAVQPVVATGGYYLQLGAYTQAANAEAMRARIAQGWADGVPMPEVAQSGSPASPVYRLYSGPFASRIDAEAAARRVQSAGTAKPMIVQR